MKKLSLLFGIFLPLCAVSSLAEAAAPLLKIQESLKNGVQTLFIQPVTTFDRSALMLDASLDGVKAKLEHPGANLWLYQVTQPSGSLHTLSLQISLGNARKVGQVEESITAVNASITALQAQLAAAIDPAEIARLNTEILEKQKLRNRLEAERENLKNFIATQNYYFHANF